MARFEEGYIKWHRKAFFGDIGSNIHCLGLWVALLSMATWKPSKIIWKGQRRELPPGSVVFGLRELSETLNVSKSTVSRWLDYLQKTERIQADHGPRGSVVTVLNWSIYQGAIEQLETAEEREVKTGGTPGERQRTLSKEVKKGRSKELHPLAEIWNSNCGNLSQVKGIGKTRQPQVKARWEENSDANYWTGIVKRIAASDFCNARRPGLTWKADFDFLIKPDTQHKALEGKYDNAGSSQPRRVKTIEELNAELANA
jgi:hypothetical protein